MNLPDEYITQCSIDSHVKALLADMNLNFKLLTIRENLSKITIAKTTKRGDKGT